MFVDLCTLFDFEEYEAQSCLDLEMGKEFNERYRVNLASTPVPFNLDHSLL
jgi:hypothetical protein